ncbi:MAG: helix-turn-helix domain-containing protein [Candidatus Omnitrophica bacterium]|nr:helix-turn-helix domain-containing protein [Candidatus Omnitrophota bacterium]
MGVREKALRLRKQGRSVREIAQELQCSKGSVSVWVRGIALTKVQKARLKKNQDVGRAKAAAHPNSPKNKWAMIRAKISDSARQEMPLQYDHILLKVLCVGLYWGEGYKKSNALFVFVNSDPLMIKVMMAFLRKVCLVPEEKFRGRLQIHPSLDVRLAEKFWSDLTFIPLSQFHKPSLAVSRSSKGIRKTLPFGTFRIIISDVYLKSRINGWLKAVSLWANSSVG